jgi:plasmanylethanolamine desaturase
VFLVATEECTSPAGMRIHCSVVDGRRGRWIAAGEAASLIAAAALAALLLGASGAAVRAAPLAAAAGAAAGALAADLASGVVHWLCDRFGSEATPWVGRYLIAGFRQHHRDPSALARHAVWERSGANAFAALPVLAAAHLALGRIDDRAVAGFALGAALAFSVLVALANEIHLQAHRAAPPRPVAWLQRLRLILPPEHHARHHRGAHDRAYCIATGWSNLLLDRLAVFARLEGRLRGRP